MFEFEEISFFRVIKKLSAVLSTYFEVYYKLKKVYRSNENHRSFLLLKDTRNFARELYIWPDEVALQKRSYKWCTAFVVLILFIFWATIAVNVFATYNDIVAFGENLMFLLGVSLVFFKTILIVMNCKKMNAIVNCILELHERFANSKNQRILDIQRSFFISEAILFLIFFGSAIFLTITLNMQPILTEQSIPLPALFPFNLQDPQRHPWGVKFIYGFQALAIFLALLILLMIDNVSICCITQITVNLRILSVRLRELGKASGAQNQNENFCSELRELVELHQYIIYLVDQINDVYYFNYLSQAFSSTFMLGTAGFEALLTLDDTMVAFKFVLLMLIAAMQLIYWCMIGNIVYYDSQDVADAAFEAHEWFAHSIVLQRNLMFVILRAQKPLQIRARPFLPFTMETFTKIIKLSYTSFTLLCYSLE